MLQHQFQCCCVSPDFYAEFSPYLSLNQEKEISNPHVQENPDIDSISIGIYLLTSKKN